MLCCEETTGTVIGPLGLLVFFSYMFPVLIKTADKQVEKGSVVFSFSKIPDIFGGLTQNKVKVILSEGVFLIPIKGLRTKGAVSCTVNTVAPQQLLHFERLPSVCSVEGQRLTKTFFITNSSEITFCECALRFPAIVGKLSNTDFISVGFMYPQQ